MRLPLRPLALAPTLTMLALAASPAASHAASSPKIPCYDIATSGWTYATKPRSCATYDPAGIEIVPVTITGLTWKKWGSRKTTGSGKAKTEAFSGKVTVEASGLRRCSSTVQIYTRVKVTAKIGQLLLFTGLPCPPKA